MSIRSSLGVALAATLFGVLPACGATAASDRAPSRPPTRELGAPSGTVLFVLTGADTQTLARGKTRRTGYFLGEFYEAYRAVRDAGFDVAIATPDGRAAPVDPESLAAKYWEAHPSWLVEAQALVADDPDLNAPMRIDAALATESEFAALVVPGGQGLMTDLVDDPAVHTLLVRFAATARPIGLVCHAPAILTHLPRDADPLRGRRVTSVSGFEEFYIERFVMHGRARERRIGRRLSQAGYRYVHGGPGRPFAVRDGNLVTSQNPFSGDAFAQEFVAALEDWRAASVPASTASDAEQPEQPERQR